MASKNVKRALMGFAAGALQATGRYFETQRAQEAERLKEERLAAIRASERAEDRAFQRETFNLQSEREMSREERMQARQLEAEGRAERRAIEAEGRATEKQLRLMEAQGEIGARYRPPQNAGHTIMRAPDGTVVSIPNDDPRFRGGELKGYELAWDQARSRQPEPAGSTAPSPQRTTTRQPTVQAVNDDPSKYGGSPQSAYSGPLSKAAENQPPVEPWVVPFHRQQQNPRT